MPADLAPSRVCDVPLLSAHLFLHEIISLIFVWSDKIDNNGLQKEVWQSYPYRFQTVVESSGSAVPSDTITVPSGYDTTNYEWYDYSIWDDRSPSDFVPSGAAVYSVGSATSVCTVIHLCRHPVGQRIRLDSV